MPGGGWDVQLDPEFFYDRTALADESLAGGLARLPKRDAVVSAAVFSRDPSLVSPLDVVGGAVWYATADDGLGSAGQHRGYEVVCGAATRGGLIGPGSSAAPFRSTVGPRSPWTRAGSGRGPTNRLTVAGSRAGRGPAAPSDDEWKPARTIGDIEVLCGPAPVITPTPAPPTETPTVTSTATPTPTPTATPTATATSTPTATPRPTPAQIYLPIILHDRCDPAVRHADVVLVLDASLSMLDPTRTGRSKVAAAVEAARLFLEQMRFPADRAAVVTFNASAAVLQDLTTDRGALLAALDRIENRELTRIHLGIEAAHGVLIRARPGTGSTPTIILLTDGRSNPDPVAMWRGWATDRRSTSSCSGRMACNARGRRNCCPP